MGKFNTRRGIPAALVYAGSPKMEFLDINLTKDLSIFLCDSHSSLYWRILNKTILFSCYKNKYKKIRETRKLESIHK
jgi:hypothetical protein